MQRRHGQLPPQGARRAAGRQGPAIDLDEPRRITAAYRERRRLREEEDRRREEEREEKRRREEERTTVRLADQLAPDVEDRLTKQYDAD